VRYFDIFVISVGNITVGGTGKTPFVEYLVRALSHDYRIAVLSRGYKRTTRGFRFVDSNATPGDAGDEPYQIKQKFPDIVVAVDANRVNGIAQIRKVHPDTQIILLDDAFQYRKIRPNLSILLADYNRPLYCDSMLPGGNMREWSCFANRADIMVITKSPADITLTEQKNIERRYIRIFQNEMFFAITGYGEPKPVFHPINSLSTGDIKRYDVLLLTGIANPNPFEAYIIQYAASVRTLNFPDHHAFTKKDINTITEKWNNILSTNKILLTTEKDAVRLQQMEISEAIAKSSYYIPVEVNFAGDCKEQFYTKIEASISAFFQPDGNAP
jgi:tetraacyldisaccharide 4'-kinase